MTLPIYIPIKDAAAKYGYSLSELKKMAQSGKINAAVLPDGGMVVSENELEFPVINSKKELEAYKNKHYADLIEKATWISEAARIYGVQYRTIVNWVKAGHIAKMGMDQNRVLISEQDVAFYADIYKKYGGQGRRLFDADGVPQRPKTGPLAV